MDSGFSKSTHGEETTGRVLCVLTHLVQCLEDLVETSPAVFAVTATFAVDAHSQSLDVVGGLSG